MSYLDPYGEREPRGWPPPQDEPGVRPWPDADDAWPRARHSGAAPDPYSDGVSYDEGDRAGWAADPIRTAPSVDSPPVDYPSVDPAPADYPTDYPTAEHRPVARRPTEPPLIERPPAGRRRAGRRRAGRRLGPAGQSTPRASRAGRNLPAAIGVGLALGALILVPLFLYPPAFAVVIAAAVAVGIWELTRAVSTSGANPPLPPLLIGGVLMIALAWWAGPDALSLGLLATVLATLVWRLADGPANYQRDLTAAVLVAVYVPFLGGFAALLTAAPDGDVRVLVTLVAVVLSDTGGYAAGVSLGRHPMAPSVSPKKSWEGFAGSVVAAAAGSALLLWWLLDVRPYWGALFGVAVSIAAVLGDLAESMIKRDLGIKDMSNLLPGHGGLMDRLDSILFALPTAYLLLAVLAPMARP